MEYKIFEENDIDLIQCFTDDSNTKYQKENLIKFLNDDIVYVY